MLSYRTVEGRASAEIVEKKSRFIGQIAHVETEDEALSFLDEIRRGHRDARHNVYAYIVRGTDNTTGAPRVRYSDDGEPSQTAGLPTLEVLQHAELNNVAVVVTRYFGGVLLGTGGLVRAYTQATQAAVEAAKILDITQCVELSFEIPYALYDQLLRFAQTEQAQIIDTDFSDSVNLVLRVPNGEQISLIERLNELAHGTLDIAVSPPFEATFETTP